METYLPENADLRRIWNCLSPEVQAQRIAEARERLRIVEAVQHRSSGTSKRAVIAQVAPEHTLSSVKRWHRDYRDQGLTGLIDKRHPPSSCLSPEVWTAICTLRRADPQIAVEKIVAHIATHHGVTTSGTTVKRILRGEGLARPRGPACQRSDQGKRRLELGGMKLIEAACVQTGYLAALTKGVGEYRALIPRPTQETQPDTNGRDEYGRFLPEYNKRFCRGPHDEIGPGFASVEQKRKGYDFERLHLNHATDAVIMRKMHALLTSPLVGTGRWDGIRVPRGQLLEELCGYAYMPSTLDLFTRELKYLGVASTLWEIHARVWLEQTREWAAERRAAVLYVDGTTKPIWTTLFSQSSRVSHRGKVMPALEQVALHTGYGVPLWLLTHSGRAALVKAVPPMLDRLEQMLGDSSVGRIVVIDAEGDSIPFLKGLEQGFPSRAWVTRLKESLIRGKRIFNRTNYRSYREADRVRIGVADFNDPEGGSFRMRVVEIERRSTGQITYLGASMQLDEREWKAADVADLYFDRWPNQEANFRAVNQAVGFKDVHGYGKQLVDNVSVVTELDKLAGQRRRLQERIQKLETTVSTRESRLHTEQQLQRRRERRQQTVNRHIDIRMARENRITPHLRTLREEQNALAQEVPQKATVIAQQQGRISAARTKLAQLITKLNAATEKQQKRESQRQIFSHDVELDSLFTLLKVGLVLLVQFVLKEYLGDARMDVATFLERIATLPAQLQTTPYLEIVTFEYNHRDPEIMNLMAAQCEALNAKELRTMSGKTLQFHVKPAPPPRRAPPSSKRTKSNGRFAR